MIDLESALVIELRMISLFSDERILKHILTQKPMHEGDPDMYWIWLLSQPDDEIINWAEITYGKKRADA